MAALINECDDVIGNTTRVLEIANVTPYFYAFIVLHFIPTFYRVIQRNLMYIFYVYDNLQIRDGEKSGTIGSCITRDRRPC